MTPDDMRAADARAVATGTSIETLMERAGRAVARAVRTELGGTYGRRVVVVCGKRQQRRRRPRRVPRLRGWGVRVDVFRLEDGIDRDRCIRACVRADVLVDAMFGTGFHGALEGDAAWLAELTGSRASVRRGRHPLGGLGAHRCGRGGRRERGPHGLLRGLQAGGPVRTRAIPGRDRRGGRHRDRRHAARGGRALRGGRRR